MKLTTLAIAIAAASFTMSANAVDIKFGGDFMVGYKSDEAKHIQDEGSELTLDISDKGIGGLTYFAHAELEFDGGIFGDDGDNNDGDEDDDLEIDEIYVGVKGRFGTLRIGDIENACDKLEVGGDWNEFKAASDSRGDCGGDHEGTYLYTKKHKKAEYGISHNVDTDESSVAVRYKHSKNLSLALGHIQRKGDLENITSASITAHKGKFSLKARVNDHETSSNGDNGYSVFVAYKPTKNDNFNIGTDNDDTVSVGYNRKLSKRSKLYIEAARADGGDVEQAVGVQYKF
jgi:predicted porin